jgi:sortase A
MRASPPGIASRGARAESSPVGGGATARAKRRWRPLWIASTLAVLGLALTGHALYIHAKALLAQALLHRAWVATQATGVPTKPWSWADTTPVARLIAPAHDVDLLTLAGATGRTLAFGPGHHDGSALPGEPGNAIFSAHRDTHFRFLRALANGDTLIVEMPAGQRFHYRVRSTEVVVASEMRLPRLPVEPTLTLVTCWPFDAVEPGGPLRYVVVATADRGTL